jgi:LPS-assembly lipoprotein
MTLGILGEGRCSNRRLTDDGSRSTNISGAADAFGTMQDRQMRPSASGFRGLCTAALLAAIAALSGCTATPLYGAGPTGTGVRSELSAISVLPAADRVGQLVRNELIFDLNGGALPAAPRYELSLDVVTSGGGLNIADPTTLSAGVTVSVRYALIEIGGTITVASGTVVVETRYNRSNSAFANVRAEQDAEQRAAVEAARQLTLDLAATLAAPPG